MALFYNAVDFIVDRVNRNYEVTVSLILFTDFDYSDRLMLSCLPTTQHSLHLRLKIWLWALTAAYKEFQRMIGSMI